MECVRTCQPQHHKPVYNKNISTQSPSYENNVKIRIRNVSQETQIVGFFFFILTYVDLVNLPHQASEQDVVKQT